MDILKTVMQIVPSLKHTFFSFSFKKKLVVVGAFLLVGGIILSRVLTSQAQQPQYQTAQVQKGSIISTLSENGNVAAGSQVNVTSPTDGVIEEMYIKNGDEVNAGQNLFKVKSTATPQQQATAYASYLTAVNSEKTAEQSKLSADASMWSDQQAVLDAQNNVDYKNNNSTNPSTKQTYTDLEKQSIESALVGAQKQFTASETKYKQADSAVSAAKAQLTSTWLAYQATQNSMVIAPLAGTVANISVTSGSNVSATSSSSTANTNSSTSSSSSSSSSSLSPVLVIGNFSSLVIKAQVNEVDIPKIAPGQKATITLDAFPDKTFVGTVDNVDTIGTTSSGVVTYNAYIQFVSPPADIHPGMTASIIVQVDRKDDVLSVPTSAIQTANDTSTVRVLKNGQVIQTPVEVGISSDTDTEIVSGLTEGEIVITSAATSTTSTRGQQTRSPFSGLGGGFGGTRGR